MRSKSDRPPRLEQPTLSSGQPEPLIDRVRTGKSKHHLGALREYLSRFKVQHNDDGINLAFFLDNICGMASYASKDGYLVVRTRQHLFLLSHNHSFAAGSSILVHEQHEDGGEHENELLYIRRISVRELMRLMPSAVNTRAFRDGSAEKPVNLEQFQGMLRNSTVQGNFDLISFANSLAYVGAFSDMEKRMHYIAVDRDQQSFSIYVNSEPGHGATVICRFSYNDDVCVLGRELIEA
jgi:hypothetical protein